MAPVTSQGSPPAGLPGNSPRIGSAAKASEAPAPTPGHQARAPRRAGSDGRQVLHERLRGQEGRAGHPRRRAGSGTVSDRGGDLGASALRADAVWARRFAGEVPIVTEGRTTAAGWGREGEERRKVVGEALSSFRGRARTPIVPEMGGGSLLSWWVSGGVELGLLPLGPGATGARRGLGNPLRAPHRGSVPHRDRGLWIALARGAHGFNGSGGAPRPRCCGRAP